MAKAKASKIKANDPLASTTPSDAAHQRPSGKSTRASKPKTATVPRPGKIDKIIAMIRRPNGATIKDLTRVTAWQAHSVRGAISGVRKKQGLNVVSEKSGDVRLFRIAEKAVG